MKKILNYSLIMFVFLFGVVSCQQDRLGELKKNAFRVSAEVAKPSTKVTYGVDNANNTITPQWTVGDKIIGFDDKEVNFEFSISAVDPTTKKATIDVGTYIQGEATKLYAIYYPGKTIADISSKTLAVDLSAQKGSALGDSSLVLMCATAEIDPTETKLVFDNATAIVGIKRMKIDPTTTINSVKVSGLVTSGMFKVVEGTMVLEAATAIDTVEVSDIALTSDGDGIVGTSTTPALMFATLPMDNAKINISGTTAASAEYVTLTTLKTDIAAGKYYYADKVLTTDVAAIGSTTYDCLSAAFAAAGTSTIKILKDCAADDSLCVTDGKNVTLDLNGKTITISGDNTAEPKVAKRILVKTGGSLTITDNSSADVASQGSIVAAEGTKGTSNVVAIGGTLTIAGGNIISNPVTDTTDIDAAVYGKAGATVNVTGGYILGGGSEGALSVNTSTDDITAGNVCTLNISGGKMEYKKSTSSTVYIYRSNANISGGHILNSVTSKYGGAAIMANNQSNTTVSVSVNVSGDANIEGNAQYGLRARNGMPVNISGGRISSRKPFTASGAACTVSGGELYNTTTGWDVLSVADGATIAVTGGKLYATSTTNLTSVSGTDSDIEFSGSVISNKAFINNRVKDGWVVDRNVDSKNPEYVFKLVEAENSITAEVTGATYHCTPAGARQYVNSSSSPVTLTVERDCQAGKIFFEKGREGLITLDLNGHTITNAEDDQEYIIRTNSNLVVTDGTNTTGAIDAPHCAIRVDSSAVLTINGGSFSGDGLTSVGCGVLYSTGTAEALNINGGTITCTGKDGRAVNIGSDGQMTGGSITSDGSCLRTYVSGVKFYVTGANVKIHNTTTSEVAALLSSNGTIYAQNGYYYIEGTAANPFQNHATRVYVTGGKMNVRDTLVKPASGYAVSELSPAETVEGRTYSYQVTMAAAPKASVNGVDYASIKLAMDAAINYAGDCDTVLIVLKDSVDNYRTRTFLTNTAGKPICLDLNGNTFTATRDSIFTSANRLRVKDSGTSKGKFITSGNRLFFFNTIGSDVNTKGPLYLDGCIIESSDEGSSNSKPAGSVISLYGKKGAVPELYMLNGAKIIKSKKGLGIYQRFSNVHIDNSTIQLNSTDTTDYGIYMYATTTLNLKAGSSIYVKSGHSVRSGSQYATINVYDNAYMWGGKKCISASAAGSLTDKIKIYGGYFSQDIAGDKAASGSIYTSIVVNGDQTSGTWTKDGVTYSYHITPKN